MGGTVHKGQQLADSGLIWLAQSGRFCWKKGSALAGWPDVSVVKVADCFG